MKANITEKVDKNVSITLMLKLPICYLELTVYSV